MTSISERIASMPKAELHMHLEGSLEPEMLFTLAARNGVKTAYGSPEDLRAAYRFTDLQSFLDLFYLGLTVMQTQQDFADVTAAYLAKAAREGVRHAEIYVSPQAHTRRGLAPALFMGGIAAAFAEAHRAFGMTGGVIVGIQRQFPEEAALRMMAAVRPHRAGIVALGLGGPEKGNPPDKFATVFRRAREMGWKVTAHAGEEGGADSVAQAVDVLRVDRIDHGVRCEEDATLMRRLVEMGIPMTVCPLSNVALRVFPTLAGHNLRRLLQAGLCVSLHSDDPSYFGGYINANYCESQTALGLDDAEVYALAENSFRGAFLEEDMRNRYLAELAAHRMEASPSR